MESGATGSGAWNRGNATFASTPTMGPGEDDELPSGPSSPESRQPLSLRIGWTGAALIAAGLALALAIIIFEVWRSCGPPGAWAPILAGTVVGVGLMLIGFLIHLQSLITTFEHRSSARHRELAESHRELARRVERLHAIHAALSTRDTGANTAAIPEGGGPGRGPVRVATAATGAVKREGMEKVGPGRPRPAEKCPVCSRELKGGRCERCDTSAQIQSAYLEVSKVQSTGVAVEESASLLASARECLEAGQYDEARKFVGSALHFAKVSAGRHDELSARFRKAEDGVLSLRASAGTADEIAALKGLLVQAREEMSRGLYDEAGETLDRVLRAVEALAKPQPREAGKPERPSAGISKCPKCGKSVLTGWPKCPYCLAPLS
ncbi:MAG: hypothetical protein QXH42_05900 [Thermoplasmata archaeon]